MVEALPKEYDKISEDLEISITNYMFKPEKFYEDWTKEASENACSKGHAVRVTINISDFSNFSDRKKKLILNFLHWEKQIFIISQQWDTSFVLVFQIIYFELFGFPFTSTAPSLNEIVSITFKFSDPPAIGNIMIN